MADSIAIIGAGIAGLSAAAYARMNGYGAQVFELHDKPGGLCTSWKRKGYVFDGCIHWLVGSRPGSSFNRIWKELGALDGCEIVDHDEFIRIEGADGKTLIVYTDADRLAAHMRELAPEDYKTIELITGAMKRFSRMQTPVDMPQGKDGLKMLGGMLPGLLSVAPDFMKLRKTSIQEFSARFSNPFLRETFPLTFDVPDFPLLGAIMTLAWMHGHDAGYPVGGSLEFAKRIERRCLDLGAEISYKSRVEKILVEDGRVVGVRLADGTEHKADVVISAADGHSTIFDMLEGKYTNETIRGYYTSLDAFPPIIQVSLGLARDLSSEPHMVRFPLADPILVAGKVRNSMTIRHFCYDKTLAPKRKSSVTALYDSDYDYWKLLAGNKKRYKEEKERIAETVISAVDSRMPGIKGDVEVVDVATPLTYERYTANWRGSMEGWMLNSKTGRYMLRPMRKTLPGLSNFYMIGQWVTPGGGLPPAAMSGRQVMQEICRRDKREWKAVD